MIKTDFPDPVKVGNVLTYTIQLANNGPSSADTVKWTDTVPAGTTFLSLLPASGWSCSTPAVGSLGLVSCSLDSLSAGSAGFTLVVKVDPDVIEGVVLSNSVFVTSATSDPNTGDNSAMVATTVFKADTTTALVSSINPSVFGDPVVFTATVAPIPTGGTLAFMADGVAIPGCADVSLTAGQAICTTSAIPIGSHAIAASYSGNPSYNPSIGFLSPDQRVMIAPFVNAGPDQTVDEASLVTFSGSFNDPARLRLPLAGEAIGWDFGDGSVITGTLVPAHTYADDGHYTVTLTVTDTDGLAGQDSLQITVNNLAPTVEAGPGGSVLAANPISFSGGFSDPGSLDTHTILWDFADGATASGTLTPSHTFASPGTYTVTLTVTDDDGGAGQDTTAITVTGSQLVYDPGDHPGSTSGATPSPPPRPVLPLSSASMAMRQ